MTMRLILPLLALQFLTGCSALSALGQASRPLEIYELRTPTVQAGAVDRRGVELVVEEPIAGGALSTERIMIRPAPLQAQYLPDVRWADAVPAMLQTLIVRSLLNTDALASVGRRPIGTRADYVLLGELTDFQAETLGEQEGATVRLRLIARLVREGDARVVATRTFTAEEPVSGTDVGTLVAGFDRANRALLSDLVQWVLARVR